MIKLENLHLCNILHLCDICIYNIYKKIYVLYMYKVRKIILVFFPNKL